MASASRLDVQEGDHICIVGGGVADAMRSRDGSRSFSTAGFPNTAS